MARPCPRRPTAAHAHAHQRTRISAIPAGHAEHFPFSRRHARGLRLPHATRYYRLALSQRHCTFAGETMRKIVLLAAMMLAMLIPTAARAAVTTTTEVDAVAMAHDAFALTPAARSASRPIVIDATPAGVVRVTAVSRTLTVALRAPNGTRFTVGDAETAAFAGARSDSAAVANGDRKSTRLNSSHRTQSRL